MRTRLLAPLALTFLIPLHPGSAAAQEQRIIIERSPELGRMATVFRSANRPMLGLTLAAPSLSDTLGLEVTAVSDSGPAAKAGITVGSRLQAVGGVSLRMSRDDAADAATVDIGYRRLMRELDARKPGDVVELQVLESGRARTVSVTTVDASALVGRAGSPGASAFARFMPERATATVGLTASATGHPRDTLGVFVGRVTPGGPADKAGLMEGDRIASVNGVDVRVPREDASDRSAGTARVSRFRREVAKASPGDDITLRVLRGGQAREIRVTAAEPTEAARSLEWDGLQELRGRAIAPPAEFRVPRLVPQGAPLLRTPAPPPATARPARAGRVVL